MTGSFGKSSFGKTARITGRKMKRTVGVKLVLARISVAGLLGVATPAVANGKATLAVVVTGAGSVSSRPAGISCPGACVGSFLSGDEGHAFAKSKQRGYLSAMGGLMCR